MFQQLSSPAKVTVFNEISGVEPTALFQEEENNSQENPGGH